MARTRATEIAIICPITSRNCSSQLLEQPLFEALLPSLVSLRLHNHLSVYLGYDHDDPLWSDRENRKKVPPFIDWIRLEGLTGKITSIWNEIARVAKFDYLIPGNDDLTLITSPLEAVSVLEKRNNFGICAFSDAAFPDWPTFYLVHKTHFDIFGCLYPLPWEGAHQDPWIADVYRPWEASEIDERFKCHNHIGIAEPRFDYGSTVGYRKEVACGRRKVNDWLKKNPNVAEPLLIKQLNHAMRLI